MDLRTSFKSIIENGLINQLKEASNTNIEISTAGGKVWWSLEAEHLGWRLQKHKITGHYRVLDTNDCRIAWGSDLAKVIANIAQDHELDAQFQE